MQSTQEQTKCPIVIPGVRIGALIGKGNTGWVFQGLQEAINRPVAVKVMLLPDPSDETGCTELERVRREAVILGSFDNSNILRIYDYGEKDGYAYLVEELIVGRTLRQRLADQERVSLPELRRIMRDVVSGFEHSHRRGVLHRDPKPANIMQRADGSSVVIDFGLARSSDSTLTLAGTAIGTPLYVAPEQWRGEPIDFRADIYSTAATMYHVATWMKPYPGNGIEQVIAQVLKDDPVPPSQIAPHLPPEFDAVIRCAMAKNPAYRYETMTEFGAAVERALSPCAPLPDDTVVLPRATEDRARSTAATTVRAARTGTRPRPAKRRRWFRLLEGLLLAG